MKLLEELWYGNIEPTEYDTSSCREYKELLQQIARKEETLLKNLSKEKSNHSSNIPTVCGSIKQYQIVCYSSTALDLAQT